MASIGINKNRIQSIPQVPSKKPKTMYEMVIKAAKPTTNNRFNLFLIPSNLISIINLIVPVIIPITIIATMNSKCHSLKPKINSKAI